MSLHEQYMRDIDFLLENAKHNERALLNIGDPRAVVGVNIDDPAKAKGLNARYVHWSKNVGNMFMPQTNNILSILSNDQLADDRTQEAMLDLAASVAHEIQHNQDVGGLSKEQYDAFEKQNDAMPYIERPTEIRSALREGMENYANNEGVDDIGIIDKLLTDVMSNPSSMNTFIKYNMPKQWLELKQNKPEKYQYLLKQFYKLVKQLQAWQQNANTKGSISDARLKTFQIISKGYR